jgi:hypothetical protein
MPAKVLSERESMAFNFPAGCYPAILKTGKGNLLNNSQAFKVYSLKTTFMVQRKVSGRYLKTRELVKFTVGGWLECYLTGLFFSW